jgi:hypothetical protein
LRYNDALSASIRGTGAVLMKREVKDIFTNGYNKNIMRLHQANHDFQMVIDAYACAQYVCGYLTKKESGISKLLQAVNEECDSLKQMERLNKLAAILDKHREVSVQEAVYRLLSLPMTKSSPKVKFISTIHPNFRDGLLKGNMESLSENESIFHNSPHQYYESRPVESNEPFVNYDEIEKLEDYWDNLSSAEFWSDYEIVYDKSAKPKNKFSRIQTLINGKGLIRKRKERAILRYYINYDNDEDMARGLLILFMPFRDEMEDIHRQDVKKLLHDNEEIVNEKRIQFEKYKVMTDLINQVHKEQDKNTNLDDEEECQLEETTSPEDIEDFNSWVKTQALKEISKFKDLTDLCDIESLRLRISSLNQQQRRIFDDFIERAVSTDINEPHVFLFISGNAGTGKSHVVRILIEAVKIVKIKAGSDLKKPVILVMAPTANAAFIIGGRTIDSALGFVPMESNRYVQSEPERLAKMKFLYEDVWVLFIDEISMVGSKKLTKINFRLQDLADGEKKLQFMGGRSLVASGD